MAPPVTYSVAVVYEYAQLSILTFMEHQDGVEGSDVGAIHMHPAISLMASLYLNASTKSEGPHMADNFLLSSLKCMKMTICCLHLK